MAPPGIANTILFVSILATVCSGRTLHHVSEAHPLASELSSRLAAHAQDARLPLPTPQDIEAIKKVAQILVMLGEQVIPLIIGDYNPPNNINAPAPAVDVPMDSINEDSS
ncbi:hypothetical protein evm_006272 [Chilo suppressalis]|nr:hypothetical protein evm_006272 [Chilo suppressalis]